MILAVFFYHVALIFSGRWLISDEETNPSLYAVLTLSTIWRMPLLFFVSGVGAWFLLRRRFARDYLAERTHRLLIPLIVGLLLVVPPAVYYSRQLTIGAPVDFFAFYVDQVKAVVLHANLNWEHLWFIAYLFLMSVAMSPFFIYLKTPSGWRILLEVASRLRGQSLLLLPALPLVVIELGLRATWPGEINLVDDWASFLLYLTFFVYGYMVATSDVLWRDIARLRHLAFGLASVGTIALVALVLNDQSSPYDYGAPTYVPRMVLRGLTAWWWLVVFVGFAMVHLNRGGRLLTWSRQAIYPFYVLHQSVIVVVGFYVIQWSVPATVKYVVISAVSLAIVVALLELVVKRTRITRFLFGLKPSDRSVRSPIIAQH